MTDQICATLLEREPGESRDALPACLPPWVENPYRLVSLWDIMIDISAERVFWAGFALENLKTDCLMKPGPGAAPFPIAVLYNPIDAPTRDKTLDWLEYVKKTCFRAGLAVTSETIAEIQSALSTPPEPNQRPLHYQWLMDKIKNVQDLVRKEAKTKVFLYVPPEKMRFWPTMDKQDVFGEEVGGAFPSAKFDAAEAGTCLALSRATACVFHLMRVLEIGLGVLGSMFSISLAHTNWAPAIEQIESKIRDMHKDPIWKVMPDCKEQQEFYAQAASHFGILKDAWRNYTAHARGIYTEETAQRIFDNVGDFMQKLATRLHE